MNLKDSSAPKAKRVADKNPRDDKQRIIGVRVPKLSHLVAERLRSRIASRELNAGDTLPSEAELVRLFDVSRPIMREALRVLEAESLIQLGRGARAGATVLAPSIGTAAKFGVLYLATMGTTLGMIHEVRSLLEPPLIALLARRPSKTFLQELQEVTAMQDRALEDKDHAAAILAVNEFHHRMLGLSYNSALNLLAGMLHGIAAAAYPRLLLGIANQKAVGTRTEESIAAHAQLLTLISAGKAVHAETFWREYMQETAEFFRKFGLANKPVELLPDL
ncbi:MAG: GntR family transcriptional regulator [Steroidobacteraceae bacterium]